MDRKNQYCLDIKTSHFDLKIVKTNQIYPVKVIFDIFPQIL